jgi:lipid-binding SYLF domain-containing protein
MIFSCRLAFLTPGISFSAEISTMALRLARGLVICASLVAPAAHAQAEQRTLVTSAAVTFADFLGNSDMTWLRQNVARAKAVLIAPGIARAGLIVGGSAGRAVLVVRDPKSGRWFGPAFYTLATGSVGLQAGVALSELVTLVMTDAGLQKLLSVSFLMGGDAVIAAGPIGTGGRLDFVADFVSFRRSEGAYVGLNLTGTVVSIADDWNRLYYGRSVSIADILVGKSVHNDQADELLSLAATAAKN